MSVREREDSWSPELERRALPPSYPYPSQRAAYQEWRELMHRPPMFSANSWGSSASPPTSRSPSVSSYGGPSSGRTDSMDDEDMVKSESDSVELPPLRRPSPTPEPRALAAPRRS